MIEPVFLPLMCEDQPDTAERVRRQVQAIPFALPEIRFRETEIRKMTYVGPPRVFRIKDEVPKCP
jgi:hypothetical protein